MTDYSGFGVCPAAIERDVLMACHVETLPEASTSKVTLNNLNPTKFSTVTFEFDSENLESVTIDDTQLKWDNYFKAGLKVGLFIAANKLIFTLCVGYTR